VRSPPTATTALLVAAAVGALALVACQRDGADEGRAAVADAGGQVRVTGDDRLARSLTWDVPDVRIAPNGLADARQRAAAALEAGRLHAGADAAIPLYLAILEQAPGDPVASRGLQEAMVALLAEGDAALADAGDDAAALRNAHVVAAVARVAAPDDEAVRAYLARVDRADRLWALNSAAEQDISEGRLGESGDGALDKLREALRIHPGQGRALQGLAAVESGLIRRAEEAALRSDFDTAGRWLAMAEAVRPGSATIEDARARIAGIRRARIADLRDQGLAALQQRDREKGLDAARASLDALLRIAEPGSGAAAELRTRIDLVTHYGWFHPGQAFTDALGSGGRGPEMVVVPHGAFRMGAPDDAEEASESEQPAHNIRFDRGFAMSRTEVTVDQFRRFVASAGYRTTAERRGYSMVYDPRSGNFVRRNGVDWRHGFDGDEAAGTMPVLHVSARDADAYAEWLGERSGHRYRLPSEAEFEYALRAGSEGRYPWGDGAPPRGAGNLTGGHDRSARGRRWNNAFMDYGDGYWGPAPVATFSANAFSLHDLAGNVSEWVADCWHDGYRRAPADGKAWVNPGCRTRVMRGGAWASAPAQTRSAWRAPADADTANARLGFRVVRDL
jgi:formylglycine-generating enzyme required for sulfatase activity